MVKINKEANVPLLPYDLGYEETILQLIKSLDCLDKVVDCVFAHVRGNVNSQKLEIVKLNDKLNNVANKVQRLSSIKKSIQVYSSSKYPATHCHKDYEYSYDFDVKSDIVKNIEVDHQICVSNNPSDKLKFYHVNNERKKILKNKDTKGLGGLPDDLKYLSSLLLFNSNENLYKSYALSNQYRVKKTTNNQVENIDENINKPVFSLPLNETENQFDFSYTPVSEEVPSIDVPADLPDLPGIAGDVLCFNEIVNIKESVACQPSNVVDLPSFDELDNLKDDDIIADDSKSIVQDIVKSELEQSLNFVSDQSKAENIESTNSSMKNDQNISKINENDNTHSVLMDEIRNAGGLKKANLRSVGDRKVDDETVPSSGGLMADLHKKLAMRRKGISGSNKQNDSGLEGVFYRMASTMLPPNESESEADVEDDTEGDWDD